MELNSDDIYRVIVVTSGGCDKDVLKSRIREIIPVNSLKKEEWNCDYQTITEEFYIIGVFMKEEALLIQKEISQIQLEIGHVNCLVECVSECEQADENMRILAKRHSLLFRLVHKLPSNGGSDSVKGKIEIPRTCYMA